MIVKRVIAPAKQNHTIGGNGYMSENNFGKEITSKKYKGVPT